MSKMEWEYNVVGQYRDQQHQVSNAELGQWWVRDVQGLLMLVVRGFNVMDSELLVNQIFCPTLNDLQPLSLVPFPKEIWTQKLV